METYKLHRRRSELTSNLCKGIGPVLLYIECTPNSSTFLINKLNIDLKCLQQVALQISENDATLDYDAAILLSHESIDISFKIISNHLGILSAHKLTSNYIIYPYITYNTTNRCYINSNTIANISNYSKSN